MAAQKLGHRINRRGFLQQASAASLASLGGPLVQPSNATPTDIRRNQQSDMAYRRLGRTGFMVSEVGSGGDPVRPDNIRQIELAIDMGMNYLDMAPAYGKGECEKAYGMIVGRSSMRERVFMNTKISSFNGIRNRMYKDIYNGLPTGKQEAIVNRAAQMRIERGLEKPGYFITYFTNQARAFDSAFLTWAMMRDYSHKVEGSPEFRKFIISSLETSLQLARTDYFDIVMCPHGATGPEDVQNPEIYETFAQLKRDGKVRALGVSSHNDPAGVLRAAADTGHYDVVMMAYNIINGGYVEESIRYAAGKGLGIIGMKVAMAVANHHKDLQPVPEWRLQKIQRIVPGNLKIPQKAYLWALQNPNLSMVVSNLWDDAHVKENLSLAGKKVTLQPG